MPAKKNKPVRFDAMVKFFMQNYEIVTKRDLRQLMTKLDRIERLMESVAAFAGENAGKGMKRDSMSAADAVLGVIKEFRHGARFPSIKERTGFDDKKLRNIIYRLHKKKMIKRKARGIYIAS